MEKVTVKFGEWMEKGFSLYTKKNMGMLVAASAMAMLLSTFTLGILAGPMMAGLALVALRLARGQPTIFNDVFKGFDYFLQSFLLVLVSGAISLIAFLVLNLIPCIGQVAAILAIYAIQAVVLFAVFLIVDRRMDFWPACMKGLEAIKNNPGPLLVFCIVVIVIGSLGSVLCGVGVILTMPAMFCIYAVSYLDIFDKEAIPVEATEVQDEPSGSGADE